MSLQRPYYIALHIEAVVGIVSSEPGKRILKELDSGLHVSNRGTKDSIRGFSSACREQCARAIRSVCSCFLAQDAELNGMRQRNREANGASEAD